MTGAMEDVPKAALFNLRPSQPYYVQSPSPHSDHQYSPAPQTSVPEPSRFSLYSSSRNSAAVADVDEEEGEEEEEEGRGIITVRDILVKNEYEDEGERYYERKRRGCIGFLRIGRNSSNAWICLQIGLRLVFSLSLALLVFYVATKPPRPAVSIQMGGISGFELAEGVDTTGIPTKILSCNSSIHLLVDNKSKVLGLQLHNPLIRLYFDRLLLAASQGFTEEMKVESYQTAVFKVVVGTKHKPMYGAGRSMQDVLESGKGLPLVFKLSVKSSFNVLGRLINPKFYHKAKCEVFLTSHYNKKHHTQSFNSSCKVTSS